MRKPSGRIESFSQLSSGSSDSSPAQARSSASRVLYVSRRKAFQREISSGYLVSPSGSEEIGVSLVGISKATRRHRHFHLIQHGFPGEDQFFSGVRALLDLDGFSVHAQLVPERLFQSALVVTGADEPARIGDDVAVMPRTRADLLALIKDLHDAPLGGFLADHHLVIPGDEFHIPRFGRCRESPGEYGETQQKFLHFHFLSPLFWRKTS